MPLNSFSDYLPNIHQSSSNSERQYQYDTGPQTGLTMWRWTTTDITEVFLTTRYQAQDSPIRYPLWDRVHQLQIPPYASPTPHLYHKRLSSIPPTNLLLTRSERLPPKRKRVFFVFLYIDSFFFFVFFCIFREGVFGLFFVYERVYFCMLW
jgi:hypothetical protein